MRSLTYVEPHVVEWREVPEPQLEDPGDALVRPIASTTCDLDQKILAGETRFEGPFAIGHEALAEVLDVADDVRGIEPGQIVVVPWHIACGRCDRCAGGLTASCREHPGSAMYGLPVGGTWGGLFDDVVRVPHAPEMLVRAPAGLPLEHVAAAGDNLSLAYEVVARHLGSAASPFPRALPVTRVLVLGGYGSVGLYAVDIARALGTERVVYVDADSRRREVARSLGAEVDAGPPRVELGEFDLAVDASVNPSWLRSALLTLAHEGTCESVCIYFEEIDFPVFQMVGLGVRFRIARGNARTALPGVLQLVEQKRIHPERATTAVLDWETIPDAIAASDKPVFLRDPIAPS